MSERTAVYRLYDASGTLLYVGVSTNPVVRWVQHSGAQSWWSDVIRFEIAWTDTREDALLEEKRAMHDERPLYNRSGSPWRPIRRSDGKLSPAPKPGPTPVRNLRVADEVWKPALAKARSEGRTLTDVITACLRAYIAGTPEGQGDDAHSPES